MLLEVIQVTRATMPKGMPLLVRVSATEWMEENAPGSWDVESTIKLAKLLPGLGVDLLDVSSGGNAASQTIKMHSHYQIDIAGRIRSALFKADVKGLLIGGVGMITEAEFAKEMLENGKPGKKDDTIEIENEDGATAKADVVLVGRQFLREPEWVLRVGFRLGVDLKWPNQYSRGQFLKGSRI